MRSVGLTTQPKVTLAAATGYRNLVFGAEVGCLCVWPAHREAEKGTRGAHNFGAPWTSAARAEADAPPPPPRVAPVSLLSCLQGAYDTAKSVVSNYGLALGLHAGDSQLAVHLQVRRPGGV